MKWVRSTRIPEFTDEDGDVILFDKDPKPNDIQEGEMLNDSYLLSTLSVMAEDPLRVRLMFHD